MQDYSFSKVWRCEEQEQIEIDIERARNNAEEISKEQEEFETVVQFKTEVVCTAPAEKSIVIKTNKEGGIDDDQVPTGWSEVLQENVIIPDGWKAEYNIKQSTKVKFIGALLENIGVAWNEEGYERWKTC